MIVRYYRNYIANKKRQGELPPCHHYMNHTLHYRGTSTGCARHFQCRASPVSHTPFCVSSLKWGFNERILRSQGIYDAFSQEDMVRPRTGSPPYASHTRGLLRFAPSSPVIDLAPRWGLSFCWLISFSFFDTLFLCSSSPLGTVIV